MLYRIIKYAALLLLHALLLWHLLPFGDYCSGMIQGLGTLLYTFLYLAVFAIFTVIDASGYGPGEKRVDFIALALLGLFVVSEFAVISADDRKFWTRMILSGSTVEKFEFETAQLKLYADNTFAVTTRGIEQRCTYQGEYEIKNSKLILNRPDLGQLTDSTFATAYAIDVKNNLLIAGPPFKPVHIEEVDIERLKK